MHKKNTSKDCDRRDNNNNIFFEFKLIMKSVYYPKQTAVYKSKVNKRTIKTYSQFISIKKAKIMFLFVIKMSNYDSNSG